MRLNRPEIVRFRGRKVVCLRAFEVERSKCLEIVAASPLKNLGTLTHFPQF